MNTDDENFCIPQYILHIKRKLFKTFPTVIQYKSHYFLPNFFFVKHTNKSQKMANVCIKYTNILLILKKTYVT
jgi:hypothetical protein